MASWLIGRVGAISPPSGGAFDAAYCVRVASGSSTREVVVEFVAPSAVASGGYAEEIVRRYLRDEHPPEHLVVEIGGDVRVLTEGGGAAAGEPSAFELPHARDPRRARNRHRG